jgi:integrase
VEHFCKHLLETRGLSWKTTEKRVSQIRSLYKRAVKARLLQENPALHVEVPKPRNPLPARVQYEQDDLECIFRSAIYTVGDRPSGGKGEAAAWLPLLALYTGARLEELSQLRLDDIGNSDGIDFIRITDEGPHQKLKNKGSRRRIPMHSKLVKAGFLKYVERLRKAGEDRLFPELKQDSKGDWGGVWSKFWGKYARRSIGLDDKRKTFHSFRHTFKTACRHAGLTEEVHDALTGHSGGGVGRRYGRQSLQALSEAIARIEYPGVPVPRIEPPE